MTLQPCPECGRPVSDRAVRCPKCDIPLIGDGIPNIAPLSLANATVKCPECEHFTGNRVFICGSCGYPIRTWLRERAAATRIAPRNLHSRMGVVSLPQFGEVSGQPEFKVVTNSENYGAGPVTAEANPTNTLETSDSNASRDPRDSTERLPAANQQTGDDPLPVVPGARPSCPMCGAESASLVDLYQADGNLRDGVEPIPGLSLDSSASSTGGARGSLLAIASILGVFAWWLGGETNWLLAAAGVLVGVLLEMLAAHGEALNRQDLKWRAARWQSAQYCSRDRLLFAAGDSTPVGPPQFSSWLHAGPLEAR